jgi:hypothetical protein
LNAAFGSTPAMRSQHGGAARADCFRFTFSDLAQPFLERIDRGGFVWTPRPFGWKCAKSHQLHAPRAKN